MNDRTGFDRMLVSWLDSETRAAPQDLHADVIGRVRTSPQRPTWLARLLSREAVAALRVGARYGSLATQIAMVILLLALALALALAFAGSRPGPPPPFGPAANGSLIFDRGGDIALLDLATGQEQTLVAGAADDKSPLWSRDGTKFAFVRTVDGVGGYLMAANADGRGVRQLAGEPLQGLDGFDWTPSWDWSPDGTSLAVYHEVGGRGVISIYSETGRPATTLDFGGVEPWGFVAWRPPIGSELIFVGHPDPGVNDLAVYGVRPDGTELRQIAIKRNESPGRPGSDPNPVQYSYQSMVLSDDGHRAAFWNWEPTVVTGRSVAVHVLDLDSGDDRRMEYDPASNDEMAPVLSPDARFLAFEAGYDAAPNETQIVVVPLDGSRLGKRIGPAFAGSDRGFEFSPDASKILLLVDGSPLRMIDISTGATEDVETLPGLPDWQRRAP